MFFFSLCIATQYSPELKPSGKPAPAARVVTMRFSCSGTVVFEYSMSTLGTSFLYSLIFFSVKVIKGW